MRGRDTALLTQALWLLLAAAAAGPASAALGDNADSIQADQLRLQATHRQSAGLLVQTHTLTLADGSTVRQHVSAAGRVFAVDWNTRAKPRLDQLLGSHFAAYAEAGRRAMQQHRGLVRQGTVHSGDLVVESTQHLNAHVGRAYLLSLLPPGVSPDALR